MLKVIFICVNDALLIKGKRKRREKYIKCNFGIVGESGVTLDTYQVGKAE